MVQFPFLGTFPFSSPSVYFALHSCALNLPPEEEMTHFYTVACRCLMNVAAR